MIEIILKLIACAISCDTPTRVSRSRCELSTCLKMMIIQGFGRFFLYGYRQNDRDNQKRDTNNKTAVQKYPVRVPDAEASIQTCQEFPILMEKCESLQLWWFSLVFDFQNGIRSPQSEKTKMSWTRMNAGCGESLDCRIVLLQFLGGRSVWTPMVRFR